MMLCTRGLAKDRAMMTSINDSARGAQSLGEAEAELASRIRGEYREMPGLRLSPEQATRLWSLDRGTCALVLNQLVETGFLRRDRDGRYERTHGGY